MFQAKVVSLVLLGCLLTLNCAFAGESAQAEKTTAAQVGLTSSERFYLDTWYHAAQMSEKMNDRSTAIYFYSKVSEYFSDLKEGEIAAKKVQELTKGKKVR